MLAAAFIVFGAKSALAGTSEGEKSEITEQTKTEEEMKNPEKEGRTKAIWISQYDLSPILTVNGLQRNESDFRLKAAAMIDNCASPGAPVQCNKDRDRRDQRKAQIQAHRDG